MLWVNAVTDAVEVPLPSLADQEVGVVEEANPLELVDVVASLSHLPFLVPVDEAVVEVVAVVVVAVAEADLSNETRLAVFCLPRVLQAKVAVVEVKDAVQPADVVVEKLCLLPSEAVVKVVQVAVVVASPLLPLGQGANLLLAVDVDLKKEVPAALVEPQKAVLVVARSFPVERASPMLWSLFPCSLSKSL